MDSQKDSVFANYIEPWRNLWDITVQISNRDQQSDYTSRTSPQLDLPESAKPALPQNLTQEAASEPCARRGKGLTCTICADVKQPAYFLSCPASPYVHQVQGLLPTLKLPA